MLLSHQDMADWSELKIFSRSISNCDHGDILLKIADMVYENKNWKCFMIH